MHLATVVFGGGMFSPSEAMALRRKAQVAALSISCLLFATVFSNAADRHVACVQEQILEAGIDVGPIDGQLGARTRSGLGELRAQLPMLNKLPKLSVANASVFCRAIGLTRGSKTGWSSGEGILELVPGDQLDAQSLRRVEETAKEVSAFYEQMGVVLPHRVAFVFSSSVKEAAELATAKLREQGADHAGIMEIYQDWCRSYRWCGMSFGGVVAVNFSRSAQIRGLLAHELAHEIQAQYVENYRAPGGEERRVRQRGPKWLTEAAAMALEKKFRLPDVKIEIQLKQLEARRDFTVERLKSFHYQSSAEADDLLDYARYAGLLLASKASHTAFLDFWERTPELGWEKAFETAFGRTVESFYAEFGT